MTSASRYFGVIQKLSERKLKNRPPRPLILVEKYDFTVHR